MLPLGKYVEAKTYWKGKTDCMIEYVNKYYPKGSTYLIDWKFPHIDKSWMENPYMVKTWDVEWCFTKDINNTIYCHWALLLEGVNQ